MSFVRTILAAIFLTIFAVWSTQAQVECAFDVESVLQRVTEQCADLDENEVCYGNRDITATPRINTIDFMFSEPGDRADLFNIRSLVVEPADTSEDTWGVAQMRLQVGSETGVQDVNLLLFGQFDIANAVEPSSTIDLQVRSFEVSIRNRPELNATVLETISAGSLLTAVGRLENSTWLRVENPITRVVGWVENVGLDLINEAQSVGLLPVQEPDEPYFGAMQAFYFENGTSNLGCDTVASDGLIVQTPDGEARISLLINEVSIELTGAPSETDENQAATAFIQADPTSAEGMSVNVVDGQAAVSTGDETQTVSSGQQSTIPITVDLSPSGAPSQPRDIGNININIEPFIPTVRFPSGGGNNTASTSGNTNLTGSTSSGSGSNSSGGSTNSGNSGSGVNITTTTGDGNGNSTGNSSTSSSSSSSGGSVNVDTSNPFDNPNPDLPGSVDEAIGGPRTDPEETPEGFFTQGNIIALSLAIAAGLIVMWFLLWYTRRNRK